MSNRLTLLRVMFYAPLAVTALRVIMTIIILVWNPQGMSFRFIQVIPMVILLAYAFLYFKLYNDGDPVITLSLPTILHFLLILVFKRKLEIVPFLAPVFTDILYLVIKGIKGSMFPFEFEGEEDDVDGLGGFEESELDSKGV